MRYKAEKCLQLVLVLYSRGRCLQAESFFVFEAPTIICFFLLTYFWKTWECVCAAPQLSRFPECDLYQKLLVFVCSWAQPALLDCSVHSGFPACWLQTAAARPPPAAGPGLQNSVKHLQELHKHLLYCCWEEEKYISSVDKMFDIQSSAC